MAWYRFDRIDDAKLCGGCTFGATRERADIIAVVPNVSLDYTFNDFGLLSAKICRYDRFITDQFLARGSSIGRDHI